MGAVKFLLLCLVLLALQLDVYQCGRWGGGGSSSSHGWSNPFYTTPPKYPSHLYYNQYPNQYSYSSNYPYYQYSQPYNYNRYPIPSNYPVYYAQIQSPTPSPISTYGWLNRSPSRYPSWPTTPSPTGSTPQSARYGWGRPSYTTPFKYPSNPAFRQPTTPPTAYRNPSPTRYSGFYPQSSTSSPSRYGWQGGPSNTIRSTTPSPLSSRPGYYGGRSFGGSRSSFGGSRSSFGGSRPSISSPSFSSRPSSSWGTSKPSYSWSSSRPSSPTSSPSYGWSLPSSKPSFPSSHPSSAPTYGWKIPSYTPSKPSTSFSPSRSPASPSYGWNTPSSKPSFPPSKPTSTATSSYGWNIPSSKPSLTPSGPSRPPIVGGNPSSQSHNPPAFNKWNTPSSNSFKPSSPSSSPSHSTVISSSPSKPPAYGWNTGTTNSKTSSPWAVPGRESPYYTQNAHANSHQPSAPPNKGSIGWNPSVTNTVGSGAPRNYNSGTQTEKKRVIGSTSTGFNKPYPQQQYAPGYQSYYQPGARPGTYGYQPPAYYGGGHTTIINNNNYHNYPSYGSYSYYRPPVYYPSYHYTYHDTGSTALGFYLGYSLGHMHTPTYHYYHHHVHDTYRPVYDHYTVHYYNHYHESAPKHEEIPPNIIRECIGDSRIVCPQNTYALCTNSGSIMCVAQATSTVPCTDVKQTNCVRSYVPCVNNTAPECKGKTGADEAEVSIPCIYTTKVLGNITFINNTIVLQQQPEMESNASLATSTVSNITNAGNSSTVTVSTLTLPPNADTVTTTEAPSGTTRNRREASREQPAQAFCVTIVAQPAERKNLTENELLFQDTKNLFQRFATKAFGLS